MGGENEFNEELFNAAFAKLDASGDGKISLAELVGFFVVAAEKRGLLKE